MSLGIIEAGFLQTVHALLVIQPTVSKHWTELDALTSTWQWQSLDLIFSWSTNSWGKGHWHWTLILKNLNHLLLLLHPF